MRVFLSGFGTVGQGLMETAVIKKDLIRSLTGEELVFAGAVDSKTYYIDPKEVCCFCALGTKASEGTVGHAKRGKTHAGYQAQTMRPSPRKPRW